MPKINPFVRGYFKVQKLQKATHDEFRPLFCLTEIAMVASTLFIKDLNLQADFSEAAL